MNNGTHKATSLSIHDMNNNVNTVELPQALCKDIDFWLNKFPADQRQSAVIPALTIVQNAHKGSLTVELMNAVADYLQVDRMAAYEVATFYSMFDLKPVGKHKLYVCTNISCQLCGSDEIIEHLASKYDLRIGNTSQDGRFTLYAVECLAACDGAPMMQVGKDCYYHLTPSKLDQVLELLD